MTDGEFVLSMFVLALFLSALLFAFSLALRIGRGRNGKPTRRSEPERTAPRVKHSKVMPGSRRPGHKIYLN